MKEYHDQAYTKRMYWFLHRNEPTTNQKPTIHIIHQPSVITTEASLESPAEVRQDSSKHEGYTWVPSGNPVMENLELHPFGETKRNIIKTWTGFSSNNSSLIISS